jgi:uncharacterized membrane protein
MAIGFGTDGFGMAVVVQFFLTRALEVLDTVAHDEGAVETVEKDRSSGLKPANPAAMSIAFFVSVAVVLVNSVDVAGLETEPMFFSLRFLSFLTGQ